MRAGQQRVRRKQDRAASRIQARARGRLGRKRAARRSEEIQEQKAAVRIQSMQRAKIGRRRARMQRDKKEMEKADLALWQRTHRLQPKQHWHSSVAHECRRHGDDAAVTVARGGVLLSKLPFTDLRGFCGACSGERVTRAGHCTKCTLYDDLVRQWTDILVALGPAGAGVP